MVLVGCGNWNHADHQSGDMANVNEPTPPQIGQQQPPQPVPHEGWLTWLNAIKGLTVTNVLVIALLVFIAIPAYITWRAVNDQSLLDRFFSHYREMSAQNVNCTLREARYRGGENWYAISTGFAFQGADRYIVSVVLAHAPNSEELSSYCEALKLIADKLHEEPS
jgi:hypothetical protein